MYYLYTNLFLNLYRLCVDFLNAKFIHKLYDYSDFPEATFGQRLKKLRLSMGLSQYELGNKTGMQHSMIGSYERDEFYPTLDSINKLSTVLDINILCCDGYSKFLLESYTFKDRLFKWRLENNLTKRDAAKALDISERGYGEWENGIVMNIKSFNKVKNNLTKYYLI